MRTKSGELLSKTNTSLTITSIITGVSACKRPSLSLSLSQTRHPQLERLRSLVWIINSISYLPLMRPRWGRTAEGGISPPFVLTLTVTGTVMSEDRALIVMPGQTIMVPHLSLQTPSWLLTVSFKTEEILCLV